MNYDAIILEMLSRIQVLEKQVRGLMEAQEQREDQQKSKNYSKQIGTVEVCAYIHDLKKSAYENGEKVLILKANDIHRKLNLKNRMPIVCNAMRKCMNPGDEIVYETPSGYSSTLE